MSISDKYVHDNNLNDVGEGTENEDLSRTKIQDTQHSETEEGVPAKEAQERGSVRQKKKQKRFVKRAKIGESFQRRWEVE